MVIPLGYMSKDEFESRMRKIKLNNITKERKAKLKAEKKKYRQKIGRKSNNETSKLIAIYLFIVFNIILVYALVAMWVFRDLTYLGVLITDVAAQILLYGIYCLKAYKGKKQEELMKFEKEKLFGTTTDANDDSDVEDEEAVG